MDTAETTPEPTPTLTPSSPMTQDEIDAHWLKHIYKPDERQLTARALIAGMFLGGVLSVSNIYIGFKVGWSFGMAITSTILAFALFKTLHGLRITRAEFTKLENNTVASAASAAGYYASAGMVSAIPALYLTQFKVLPWYELALWVSAISFVGVLMAVPMRRQMIDVDRLTFPSGLACAETIKSMHETAREAVAKARSLLLGAVVAALFEIPNSVAAFGKKTAIWFTNPVTWPEWFKLPGKISGYPLASLGLKMNTSLLMYGAGAIIGIRVGVSLLIGAFVAYGLAGPWLASHGIVVASEPTIYRSLTSWSVWPGVLMVLVASLLQFFLKWRTVVQAFGSLGKIFRTSTKPSLMAPVEVPPSWFGWGMLVATAFVAILAKVIFGIPIWMGVVAVLLSFILSIVACRATGETDVTPIGPLGKITQFIYAGISPGNYTTNLMTASVTAGSASHSADLLTDLKTGYLLGGSPRRQFIAQFLGIVAGALFCVPAYLLVVQPEKIGSSGLPAPAAQQWAAVADLLAHGVSYEDRGSGAALADKVQAIQITNRPAGTGVGDTLRIAEGPNAGEYKVAMIDRTTVVLDRDLPVAAPAKPDDGVTFAAEVLSPQEQSRGKMRVQANAVSQPGLRFTERPTGSAAGDYVMTMVNGTEVYQKMRGLRGDLAMIDHAFVAGETPRPVEVKKMGLPPYALAATAIVVLFGVLVTLLELYGPKAVKPFLPSVAGLGIAWIVPCWDSLAMGTGAVIAYLIAKAWPKFGERYTVSTSSGIIAGASIMGLVIILLRDILGYIQGT